MAKKKSKKPLSTRPPTVGLAFEHFQYDAPPETIWKVTWIRKWLNSQGVEKEMKCSDWFSTEKAAWDFVSNKLGPKNHIIAVQKFVSTSVGIPQEINNG